MATRDVPAPEDECLKPNQLFLGDGTSYDITGLTDEKVDELVRKYAFG